MRNQEKIFVIGHKNPDTDSICSAIAYADIKNRTSQKVKYIPKRAGQINEETEYVLNRFGMQPPGYLSNIGTQIKDTRKEVLAAYDLGHKIVDGEPISELLDGQDPDKLFVERDISYLKDATDSSDGGRMVIVLPKQNLSGANEDSVEFRKWLLKRVQITAVIDLPREAFQPHTGTKTSLIFLKKVISCRQNIKGGYTVASI